MTTDTLDIILLDIKDQAEAILKMSNSPDSIVSKMIPTVFKTISSRKLTTESARELSAHMIALLALWSN